MTVLGSLRKYVQSHSRQPRLAFLHVPKTGGTYLIQRESDQQPVLPVYYLGHKYVVDRKNVVNPLYYPHTPKYFHRTILIKEIRRYVVISTVRNIFSWLVSYAWHAGGWNPKYNDPDHYDYTIANKGFDYLVKTIANREEPWPNRKFIHCQFFCNNGELIVNWINRNESLEEDLELLAHKNGLPFTKREKQRVGHGTDYRTYYRDELTDLVYKTWGRELDLFGYEFEGPKPGLNNYHHDVRKKIDNPVHYFLDRDDLQTADKIIAR